MSDIHGFETQDPMTGFEPATYGFVDRRSTKLGHIRIACERMVDSKALKQAKSKGEKGAFGKTRV